MAALLHFTSLTRKTIMALTGMFLCFFLVIHLIGNLQLLLPEANARESFNSYSEFLSGFTFIKIISYLLYATIIFHIFDSMVVTLHNRKTSGKYIYDKRGTASKWYSRNMGILGTLILIFLVIHFKDFWYVQKFGEMPLDINGNKDLYAVVINAFNSLWYVIIYVLSIIALGYHLLHGFYSAARTIGLYNPFYARWVKLTGSIFSYIITIGFIIIPIYIYLTRL
jgi:succinate dehydrogenase / fumarate reductase cytochrome b subunit